jgi:hypothetical protein
MRNPRLIKAHRYVADSPAVDEEWPSREFARRSRPVRWEKWNLLAIAARRRRLYSKNLGGLAAAYQSKTTQRGAKQREASGLWYGRVHWY